MEIEYSFEERNQYAYRFADWEKKAIAKGLVSEVKSRIRKIDRINNDPRNEGQCTYTDQVRELRAEVEILENIIKDFNGK